MVAASSGLWLSRSRIAIKVFLKYALAPVGFFARSRQGVRVLFYHRVNNHARRDLGLVSRELSVPTTSFAWQMAWLAKRGYRTIKLDEYHEMILGNRPMDPKAFLITFDDGYLDNLTQAAPILERHGFTAIVFPVANQIGQDNRCWPMADPEGLGDFMDVGELRTWSDAGHEVGSHTLNHPPLTTVDDTQLAEELGQSRMRLEALVGKPCTSLAYPVGDADDRVAKAARNAGYKMCFTTQAGTSLAGENAMLLRRTEVSVSDQPIIFILKMRGIFDWTGVRDSAVYRSTMRGFNRFLGGLVRGQNTAPSSTSS